MCRMLTLTAFVRVDSYKGFGSCDDGGTVKVSHQHFIVTTAKLDYGHLDGTRLG
jgi:hypothetical protein